MQKKQEHYNPSTMSVGTLDGGRGTPPISVLKVHDNKDIAVTMQGVQGAQGSQVDQEVLKEISDLERLGASLSSRQLTVNGEHSRLQSMAKVTKMKPD